MGVLANSEKEIHRTQCAIGRIEFYDYSEDKFSAFDFLNKNFLDSSNPYPLQRCFSIARSKHCKTLVKERIDSVGLIASENDWLRSHNYKTDKPIYRLSFWRKAIRYRKELNTASSSDLLGYAIVKHDSDSFHNPGWYVFESVFVKYRHRHNCVPRLSSYRIRVGDEVFSIRGVLYCQQNGLTKTCAQVSLRSLLSRRGLSADVDFETINKLAKEVANEDYTPSMGLMVKQIRHILKSRNIEFWDVYYPQGKAGMARMVDMPFQRVIYSGVESGQGSLLWFQYRDRDSKTKHHIIPFFGHTFNKDAWVSDARTFYFDANNSVGYLPGENWTSSFIGHDDNFGSDLCVPKFFVKDADVRYAVALLPDHANYPGITAEVLSWGMLEALVDQLYSEKDNVWRERLLEAFVEGKNYNRPRIVLRTIYMTSDEYCRFLANTRDKFNKCESAKMVEALREIWAEKFLWVVEVSLPQLFPANEAKVGEIVLDASAPIRVKPNETITGMAAFMFARLPGVYFFYDKESETFIRKSSAISSYTPVFTFFK